MSWDTIYRPLKFSDVLGQPGTVQVLKSRLKAGTARDISYIFSGYFGSGKTTLARIVARAILCQDIDKNDPEPCNACDNCIACLNETSEACQELDAASKGTIDNVRSIVSELDYAVLNVEGSNIKRVYIIDESHRMSRDSQDVLLKPIEDKKMVAIFCTTEPEKIRGPIRSRCEEYVIRRIPVVDIVGRMQHILKQEGVEYNEEALSIVDYCDGHVRDIINRVGMMAQLGPITVEGVREHLNVGVVPLYYQILLALDDPSKFLDLLDQACEKVTPSEVAAGISEAAMSSYRLKKGLPTSSVTADRSLAVSAYEKYGDGIIRLADKFARSKYDTKVSLSCDLLTATRQGNTTFSIPQSVVVQQVQAVVSKLPTTTSQEAPQKQTTFADAVVVRAEIPKASGPLVRPDGVGPVGQDLMALTSLDHFGVRTEMPRRNGSSSKLEGVVAKVEAAQKEHFPLTPEEWRQAYRKLRNA
jgi:DNA polymerase III subunit gamma/tau